MHLVSISALLVMIIAAAAHTAPEQKVPSSFGSHNGRPAWVASDAAIDAEGKLRRELLGDDAARLENHARQNAAQTAKAKLSGVDSDAPVDECHIFKSPRPEHFLADNSLEGMSVNARAILRATVVDVREGIYEESPGSLLRLSARYLKGSGERETYLYYPLAKIRTAEGMLCATPIGHFVAPRRGDELLIFAMVRPVSEDGRTVVVVDTARNLVHKTGGETLLPNALDSYAGRRDAIDSIARSVQEILNHQVNP